MCSSSECALSFFVRYDPVALSGMSWREGGGLNQCAQSPSRRASMPPRSAPSIGTRGGMAAGCVALQDPPPLPRIRPDLFTPFVGERCAGRGAKKQSQMQMSNHIPRHSAPFSSPSSLPSPPSPFFLPPAWDALQSERAEDEGLSSDEEIFQEMELRKDTHEAAGMLPYAPFAALTPYPLPLPQRHPPDLTTTIVPSLLLLPLCFLFARTLTHLLRAELNNPDYNQIFKCVNFIKEGSPSAVVISVSSLRALDLNEPRNQLAVRDVGGLNPLLGLLRASDPKLRIGVAAILDQVARSRLSRSPHPCCDALFDPALPLSSPVSVSGNKRAP